MAKPSSQKFIARNRAPRVQIEYDVEVYGAQKKVQIPFVMGVMADLSGDSKEPLPGVDERKFVNIDVDNFDDVMRGLEPRAAYRVKNALTEEGGTFGVDLKFRSIEDFRPEAVVQQVDPLRELLDIRTKLADLRNKLAGNDKLEDLLGEVLSSTEKLQQLTSETDKGGRNE